MNQSTETQSMNLDVTAESIAGEDSTTWVQPVISVVTTVLLFLGIIGGGCYFKKWVSLHVLARRE